MHYKQSGKVGLNVNQSRTVPRPLVRTNQAVIVACAAGSWLAGWHVLLAIPLVAGLFGALFGRNPVMRLARAFLRRPLAEYVAEDADGQRFNQWIAVACLAGALIAYALRLPLMGDVATAVVGLAAIVAMCGFCCGCFIRYQWRQYRYRSTGT